MKDKQAEDEAVFRDMPTGLLADALHQVHQRGWSIMPDEDVKLAWDELVRRCWAFTRSSGQ